MARRCGIAAVVGACEKKIRKRGSKGMNGSGRNYLFAAMSFAVVACASVLILTPSPTTAQPAFSDWGAPHLVPVVNSTSNDAGPTLSKDRLSLYFGSNR